MFWKHNFVYSSAFKSSTWKTLLCHSLLLYVGRMFRSIQFYLRYIVLNRNNNCPKALVVIWTQMQMRGGRVSSTKSRNSEKNKNNNTPIFIYVCVCVLGQSYIYIYVYFSLLYNSWTQTGSSAHPRMWPTMSHFLTVIFVLLSLWTGVQCLPRLGLYDNGCRQF